MQRGIVWYKKEKKWDVRLANIFLKKVSDLNVAIALRDTCLLKLLEDPQNALSAVKKSQLDRLYKLISQSHVVKSNPEQLNTAQEIYQRYICKQNTLKVDTVSLPAGLSFSQNRWRVKFQWHSIIYEDTRRQNDLNEALFSRDALAQILLENNAILASDAHKLARPNLAIPQKNLQYARNIYERSQQKKSEEQQIIDLVTNPLLEEEFRLLSPSPPTQYSKRPRIS